MITPPGGLRQAVLDTLKDGEALLLKPGRYYARGLILRGRSGITIRGEGEVIVDGDPARSPIPAKDDRPDGLELFDANGLTLENVGYVNNTRNGVHIEGGSNVVIRNCDFSNNGKTGLLTAYLMDVTVENCTASNNRGEHGIYLGESGDRYRVVNNRMWGNTRNGLQINATPRHSSAPNRDGISTDCLVANNETWSNSQGGILLMGVHNSTFANNLIRGNRDHGIAMFDDGYGDTYGCKNNKFWHNTVIQSGGKYAFSAINGSTGNVVQNNIFVTSVCPAYRLVDAVQSDYNCFQGEQVATGTLEEWRQASGNDRSSHQGDAGLTADYRLSPRSPARQAGTWVYATDRLGAPRPRDRRPSLGCHEGP